MLLWTRRKSCGSRLVGIHPPSISDPTSSVDNWWCRCLGDAFSLISFIKHATRLITPAFLRTGSPTTALWRVFILYKPNTMPCPSCETLHQAGEGKLSLFLILMSHLAFARRDGHSVCVSRSVDALSFEVESKLPVPSLAFKGRTRAMHIWSPSSNQPRPDFRYCVDMPIFLRFNALDMEGCYWITTRKLPSMRVLYISVSILLTARMMGNTYRGPSISLHSFFLTIRND